MAENNGSPVSWQTIFSGAMFVMVAVGAVSAVVQLQFSGIASRLDLEKHDREQQDTVHARELERREAELKSELKEIHDELITKYERSIHRDAFSTYEKGIETQLGLLSGRVDHMEQTRPTTGELAAQAGSLRDRIDRLYDIVKSQEEWIRTRGPMVPIQQGK